MNKKLKVYKINTLKIIKSKQKKLQKKLKFFIKLDKIKINQNK